MKRFLAALLFLGMAMAQPGCAWMKKKSEARRSAAERKREEEARKRVKAPLLVGTITLVNLEDRFVLIDSGTHPGPGSGAWLKSKTGTMESAELKVSDVRRNPFTIADIVEGTPLKGDLVYQ